MEISALNASVPDPEAADCEIGVASKVHPCRGAGNSGERAPAMLAVANGLAAGVVQSAGAAYSGAEASSISTRGNCKVSIQRCKVLALPLITLTHFTLLHVHRHASELPV